MPTDDDIDVIHGLAYHTPECDWPGCTDRPVGGNAHCETHRDGLTIDWGGGYV